MNYSIFEIVLNLSALLAVALFPSYLVRFVIYKKQLPRKAAIPITVLLWIVSTIISIVVTVMAEMEWKPNNILGVLAVSSYFILRSKTSAKQIKKTTDELEFNTNPKKHESSNSRRTSHWLAKNWFNLSLVLLIICSLSFVFYWYGVRPSNIKKACSYISKTTPAVEYRPALSQFELEDKGLIKSCHLSPPSTADGMLRRHFDDEMSKVINEECIKKNQDTIAKYSVVQEAKPSQKYYDKATEEEFDFCLHKNGL